MPSLELRLIVAALATFRLSSLLVAEDGPWRIFKRLRDRLEGGFFGDLVACLWCVSVWIGVVTGVLAFTIAWVVLIPLALSAAAVLLGRWCGVA